MNQLDLFWCVFFLSDSDAWEAHVRSMNEWQDIAVLHTVSSKNLSWRHLGLKWSEKATTESYLLHAFFSEKKIDPIILCSLNIFMFFKVELECRRCNTSLQKYAVVMSNIYLEKQSQV